jgi:DNA-binding IclR family transcriptional regulator
MSTIKRGVELLNLFGPGTSEIGLSEVHRRTKRDKATCYRHLEALLAVGMLEQDPVSKKYRMGPAVLRWAAIREAAVPRKASVQKSLKILAEATGELAHASILEGSKLLTLAHHDAGVHGTRVVLDVLELPLNATASGLAVLAFSEPELLSIVCDDFERFTSSTLTKGPALDAALAETKASGFGVSNQGYETGVHGISVPVFDATGVASGAIAVATVASRMEPALEANIKTQLIAASRSVSNQWGGRVPPRLDDVWQAYLDRSTSERISARKTI